MKGPDDFEEMLLTGALGSVSIPLMTIQAVRKHLVKVTYLDFGSHLDTVWRTASSVDDGGRVGDGNEFPNEAAAVGYIQEWLESEACVSARAAMGWIVERGEDIERRCDMNPHGLI